MVNAMQQKATLLRKFRLPLDGRLCEYLKRAGFFVVIKSHHSYGGMVK